MAIADLARSGASYDARVPGYLGRVLDDAYEPVATCFQFATGFIAMCRHVLDDLGLAGEGAEVSIDALNGRGGRTCAIVLALDGDHDLAIARLAEPLPDVVPALWAGTAVPVGASVNVIGYGVLDVSPHEYRYLPASGTWSGPASRDGVLVYVVRSGHIVPGMSGAPVCLEDGRGAVGIQYARVGDRAWVIPLDVLADLAGRTPGVPSVRLSRVPIAGRAWELPPEPSQFMGRTENLSALDELLASDISSKVAVVHGTAGVGKTALALRWAYAAARAVPDPFPDGYYFRDLHGYSGLGPRDPYEILGDLLRAMGLDTGDVPKDREGLMAVYRRRISAARALIVLDNVRSSQDVRPLIPPVGLSLLLVTSRDVLDSLVGEGAISLMLERLTRDQALALLTGYLGRERVERERAAAVELARRCAYLPLALDIVAAKAVSDELEPLSSVVANLNEELGRWEATQSDDGARSVRAALALSLQRLEGGTRDEERAAARLFAMLGAHPGRTYDRFASAALLGLSPNRVVQPLRILTTRHMLERHTTDRYSMHDLMFAYARDLYRDTGREERGAAGSDAIARLADYFDRSSRQAVGFISDSSPQQAASPPSSPSEQGIAIETQITAATALEWLDTERLNLIAVASSPTGGFSRRLSSALEFYLRDGGYLREAVVVHEAALAEAVECGDTRGAADAYTRLGDALVRQGETAQAIAHAGKALELWLECETDDRRGEGEAQRVLGTAQLAEGNYAGAAESFTRCLETAESVGDMSSRIRALINLGIATEHLQSPAEGYAYYLDALRLAQSVGQGDGHPLSQGKAMANLGVACERMGRYGEARTWYQRCLIIAERTGDRYSETMARYDLVYVDLLQHRFAEAIVEGGKVFRRYNAIGDRVGLLMVIDLLALCHLRLGRHRLALRLARCEIRLAAELDWSAAPAIADGTLGEVFRCSGRPGEAIDPLSRAVHVLRETGEREDEARALDSLGRAQAAAGLPFAAARSHARALRLARALGNRRLEALALDGAARVLYSRGLYAAAAGKWRRALQLFTEIELPEAAEVKALLDQYGHRW